MFSKGIATCFLRKIKYLKYAYETSNDLFNHLLKLELEGFLGFDYLIEAL